MRPGRIAFAGILTAFAMMDGFAFGAGGKTPDAVSAEALFAEGRRLMASGKYEEACAKFADSETLDPAPGTALNLAACYKKAGKLATAWAAFQSAQAFAARMRQSDRARAAKNAAAALEPTLSRLTVSVPEASRVSGLEIRCDDHAILSSEWGMALPQDGGGHEIAASAPGKQEWRTHVEVRESGDRVTVEVPKLGDAAATPAEAAARPAPAALPETPAPPPPSTPADVEATPVARGHTQRVVGLVVGATGIVAAGVGEVLAILAKSKFDTATHERGSSQVNDSASAVHQGDAATVIVSVGAGLLAAGAVVWFTSPRSGTQVGTNGRELLLGGSF
jgi:hypothetical protein